ncbi:MAG: imidazoleglycerol-phosphate dehydratase HisB [Thermodesulfobacteriota bacterium]|nr:imidazoleglycerol-phosphate dehydratase HisB [Thermodesulfobacteriota bacterium]
MGRKAFIERNTKETDIKVNLDLEGRGISKIDTGIPFIDHMLVLMAAHGFMDIEIAAKGDTDIDDHHTVEDLGICLGKAINQALGEKKGIRRYGQAIVPMDEAMARVVIDISNRPFLAYRVLLKENKTGNFNVNLIKEFFRALVNYSGITMHVDLISGDDAHHIAESIFKAFGRALDQAVGIENRLHGAAPSTKGLL